MLKFTQHPEIALPKYSLYGDDYLNPVHYGPEYKAVYFADYPMIFKELEGIKNPKKQQEQLIGYYRWLIKNDLFFIGYFICENPYMNRPFAVDKCHMVKNGPQTDTLDVWARYHLKSSIITQYETIQYVMNNPELCHVIFSYSKPAAEKHLLGIKEAFQKELLVMCFPEILFENLNEATSWSLQGGIRVKRQSTSRKEHTVQAFGLLEGMPTGGHWDRLVFDDTETEDLARNGDQIQLLIRAHDLAQSFGMPDYTLTRNIGTFYTHAGLLTHLRDKKYADDSKIYTYRNIPATDDGTKTGRPVFMSDDAWKKVVIRSDCNTQYLCNPTPTSDVVLRYSMFRPIEPQFMPKNRVKFIVVDPAGDDSVQSGNKNDNWALGCVSFKPCMDELGLSEMYIEDIIADQMSLDTAIDAIVGMYLRNGRIHGLGVEKVGNDTTYEHIRKALLAQGRYVYIKKSDRDAGNLVLLSPEGKNKEWRVESALSWPLSNSKIFYSTTISQKCLDKLKEECDKFRYIHLDILDMIAYGYKMLEIMHVYVGEDHEEKDIATHALTEYDPFALQGV